MRREISTATAFLLIAVALFVDIIEIFLTIIPFAALITPIFSPILGIVLWIWLDHVGARPRWGLLAIAALEFIPIVEFTWWTVYVIAIIVRSRLRESFSDVNTLT